MPIDSSFSGIFVDPSAPASDSAATGFVTDVARMPYDLSLEDILHNIVQGMTAIDGTLVRPRWQVEPPQQPDFSTDWVAFGVVRSEVDTFALSSHDPTGSGSSSVVRDEILHVLHSFYGPNGQARCEAFRDGFEVEQNRDFMLFYNLGLVEVEEVTTLPALMKEKWVRRVDVSVAYRRRTSSRNSMTPG